MIHSVRVKLLNKPGSVKGRYVLYWMQQSQRAEYNHALEHAIDFANEHDLPLVVYFGITDRYPHANARHYCFMLQGLKEVRKSLEKRGIKLVVGHGLPAVGVCKMAKGAKAVFVDRGYTRIQRSWRSNATAKLRCPLIQVESDVIIPIEVVSNKCEYAAATIRPKIYRLLDKFLIPLEKRRVKVDSLGLKFKSFDVDDIDGALAKLKIDRSINPVETFKGGTTEAKRRLKAFVKEKLVYYDKWRNDPNKDVLSCMSPYLHFGQISPLYIALEVKKSRKKGTKPYLEELIVRRELSMNYVYYNEAYDSFDGIPNWAKATLKKHKKDKRKYIYSLQELERAETHDPYWNAAQKEMVLTGKMHGYMRMYWGKKILEWSKSPRQAFDAAIYLNDKYELDGRDPNGYVGVSWCFGTHDRPWAERNVFGKIRYMNDKGLRRKFNADEYVRKIERMKNG